MNNDNYRDETDDEGNFLRDYDETREEREERQARSYWKARNTPRLPQWSEVKHSHPSRDPW